MPEWLAWSRSVDTVTAVVRPNGDPTTEGDTATVPVKISQTVQHSDGDTTPTTAHTATVALERHSETWLVANYKLVLE